MSIYAPLDKVLRYMLQSSIFSMQHVSIYVNLRFFSRLKLLKYKEKKIVTDLITTSKMYLDMQ